MTVTWVPEDFLAAHWKADELDLPPWSPTKGDTAGAALTATKWKRTRCAAGMRGTPRAERRDEPTHGSAVQ
jgi:hypothetical protein